MPTDPPPPPSPPPGPSPRLLSGAGGPRRDEGTLTGRTRGAADTGSFTATEPYARPPADTPLPAPAPARLPRWARGVVIGGVLLAVAMPASVLLSRSVLVQNMLQEQSVSTAALVCTAGEGRANDESSLLGWLFGGSHVQCNGWETREARQQRERDTYEANYLARERARQQR